MKTGKTLQWSILLGAMLLAFVLMLTFTPYVFGCIPDGEEKGRCVVPPRTTPADVNTASTAGVKAPPTVVPTPRGDTPQTARAPMWVKPEYCIEAMCPGAVNQPLLNSPGNWDWVPGNSTIWYWMDDGHSLQVQVWVFANGQNGLALDMFAPEQKDLYNSRPVGRGALNKNYPGSDLFYSGRSSAYGIWYARLTNNNAYPVNYSIRYTRTTPSLGNSCDNCHKAIGYEWNCTDPAFCSKLYDYLQTNPQCYSHDIDSDLAGNCR